MGRGANRWYSGDGTVTKLNKLRKAERKATHPASSDAPLGTAVPLSAAWIDQRLQALYGSVLDEPLPEEMLRLLQPGKSQPRKH